MPRKLWSAVPSLSQPAPKMSLQLDTSVFTTSRGFSYSYICIAHRSDVLKPTILFLHGFPSLALEWHNQIQHFANLGYGVIAPDLLGYGKTSRPVDVAYYHFKDLCQDVIEILDHEGIEKVCGVAHDMGVGVLSRMDFYFQHRLSKMALVATGYHPPGAWLDLGTVNKATEQQFGYSFLGYMQFFVEDSEAVEILNQHAEAFFTLMYCKDPVLWKQHLGPIGALKKWLLAGERADVGPWITQDYRQARAEAFADHGGYLAPLNWYRCLVGNINVQDEEEVGWKDFQSSTPTLLITAARDPIVLPDMQSNESRKWVGDLTVRQVDSGHWPMAEKAKEVSQEIQVFLERVDAK